MSDATARLDALVAEIGAAAGDHAKSADIGVLIAAAKVCQRVCEEGDEARRDFEAMSAAFREMHGKLGDALTELASARKDRHG